MTNGDAETLHRVLGALLVLTLIALAIADTLPNYTVSNEISMVLAIVALILLGFGSIITAWINR